MMKLVADRVLPDEPCWGMTESPTAVPQLDGSVEHRWIQDVIVIRGDQKAHFITDFGPASDYEMVTPMMVPSFGENSVAQLQELGEKNRHDHYWQGRVKEMQEGSTLKADILRDFEISRELIKNKSVFGPAHKAQRNGYDSTAVWRKWFDQRAEKTGKRQFSG